MSEALWPAPPWDALTDVLHWATEAALLCLMARHLMELRRGKQRKEEAQASTDSAGMGVGLMAESGLLRISKEDRSLLQNLFLSASTKRSSHPRHAESAESRMASRLSDDPSTRSSDEVIKYEQLEEHDSMPTHTTTSVEPERNANPSHLLVTMLVAPTVGVALRWVTTLGFLTIQQQMSLHAATNLLLAALDFYGFIQLMSAGLKIPHSDLEKNPSARSDQPAMMPPLRLRSSPPVLSASVVAHAGTSSLPSSPTKHSAQPDMRGFQQNYAGFIQRLKLLLVTNTVYLVLSAVLIVCIVIAPCNRNHQCIISHIEDMSTVPMELEGRRMQPQPQGSLAVLTLLVITFESGRGLLLFLLFGWSSASHHIQLLWNSLVQRDPQEISDTVEQNDHHDDVAVLNPTRQYTLGM